MMVPCHTSLVLPLSGYGTLVPADTWSPVRLQGLILRSATPTNRSYIGERVFLKSQVSNCRCSRCYNSPLYLLVVVAARGAASCSSGGARVSSFTALGWCILCGGGGGTSLALETTRKAFIGEGKAYGINVISV
jgi:hypothetical protein